MQHYKIHFIYGTVIAILMLIPFTVIFSGCSKENTSQHLSSDETLNDKYRNMVETEFQSKANYYNADSRYLIIVDYSIPSNQNRLFLWDTESDKIVEKFWCAHGYGGRSTAERPEFSNIIGSNCSSLGWFLIDQSIGVSIHWGYKYHAVDGLDSSNSNARQRQILIHPWSSVSYDESSQINEPMNLDGRCAGCFTISDQGFETLDRYIKSCPKRILLCAIDSINK